MNTRVTDKEISYRVVTLIGPDGDVEDYLLSMSDQYDRTQVEVKDCRHSPSARHSAVTVTDPELVRDFGLGESPVAWLRRACQAGYALDWALALFEQHLLQKE